MSSLGSEAKNSKVKSVRLSTHCHPSKVPEIKVLDCVGFYSMNSKYEFCNDLSQLRFLYLPPTTNVHFDLNINYDRIIRKNHETNEVKLDPILKWIVAQGEAGVSLNKSFLGDFVTIRGVLSTLMCTPYENHFGWIICASKFQGTTYLCKYDTPEKNKDEKTRTSKDKAMSDWGLQFEQFLLSEHPGRPPNAEEPNNQNEELACVFRSTIGRHNLVYAAEMDGVKLREQRTDFNGIGNNDSERLKKMLRCGDAEFVELKTSANALKNEWEWTKICRFKSNKWWAQCSLVGIEELHCGYRDKKGIVEKLKKFSVSELPKLGKGFWDRKRCLLYLVNFLNLVADKVSSSHDEQLWMFEWNPKNPDEIQVELCENDSRYFFLHEWATDKITSHKRKREEILESSSMSESQDGSPKKKR